MLSNKRFLVSFLAVTKYSQVRCCSGDTFRSNIEITREKLQRRLKVFL